MSKKLVFVYSIPKTSVLGIHNNTDPNSGKPLNKTKIGSTTTNLRALPNMRTRKLSNYISTQPWIEDGITKKENGRDLTLQDKLEIEWNLPKGFLTDEMVGNEEDIYSGKKRLTYFQEKSWEMQDGCTVFDLDTLDGLMGYYVCLGSKYVANSEKEWRSHKWPQAEYYIAVENEMEEVNYKFNQFKLDAFSMLNSDDMTPINKRKFAVLLNLISPRAQMTETQINNLLYSYIDNTSSKDNTNLVKFKELYTMLSKPDTRLEFEAKYLLQKALSWKVIDEKQGTYTWIRGKGNIELGKKPESVISFLVESKNKELVEELEKEVNIKSNS